MYEALEHWIEYQKKKKAQQEMDKLQYKYEQYWII